MVTLPVVPLTAHTCMYVSQLNRFARVCSYVDDFNAQNKCLKPKL